MKYKSLLLLMLSNIFFISCNSLKSFTGNYEVTSSSIVKRITVNRNKTFVIYVSTDLCSNNTYGGYWDKKGKFLLLNYVWPRVAYLKKTDTIFSGNNGKKVGASTTVIKNEMFPMDSTQIMINDSKEILYTNNNGKIYFENSISIESIKIKKNSLLDQWTEFRVDPASNNFLIMIYDYGLESCGTYYLDYKLMIGKNEFLGDNNDIYKKY